jgi:hypothetical protein
MHRLTTSEAAAEIATLINSRPASPRVGEIEAIIAKAMAAPAATPALSSEHLAYRKFVAEIERYNNPGMPKDEEADAAFSRLQEQGCELEKVIWAKPAKTLADVLLRAEIALDNEKWRHGRS